MFLRLIALFSLAASLAYLLISPFCEAIDYAMETSFYLTYAPVGVTLLAVIYFVARGLRSASERCRYFRLARLSLCAVAPLSVLYPWWMGPGFGGGVEFGGYAFFREWLVKYPDFGPVNLKVLLGMACVILAGVVPAVFAYRYALKRPVRGAFAAALLVLELAAVIPVWIALDGFNWLIGLSVLLRHWSLFMGVGLVGPVLRLLSAAVMIGELILLGKARRN